MVVGVDWFVAVFCRGRLHVMDCRDFWQGVGVGVVALLVHGI